MYFFKKFKLSSPSCACAVWAAFKCTCITCLARCWRMKNNNLYKCLWKSMCVIFQKKILSNPEKKNSFPPSTKINILFWALFMITRKFSTWIPWPPPYLMICSLPWQCHSTKTRNKNSYRIFITISLAWLCSSLTMKIVSKRDRIVGMKSIFWKYQKYC